MTELKTFTFDNEDNICPAMFEVRVVERDGNPWFVTKDVAVALGYSRTSDAIRKHCRKANDFRPPQNGAPANPTPMKIIPESDVYRLIIKSKLTSAEQFEVRVVMRDGHPWFLAKDVCDVLGIEIRNLSKILDSDEKITTPVQCTDQVRYSSIINEYGLYSLIMRSRKPQTKRFRKWVTGDVLPTIRKTGGTYMTRPTKMGGQVRDIQIIP